MWKITTADSKSVLFTRLASAWQQVVNLHSMLRAVLLTGTGSSFYVVPRSVDASFELHTLRYRAQIQASLNQCHVSTNQLPVLELHSTAEGEEQIVFLRISHARCDATSIAIILNDLRAAHRQISQFRPVRVHRDSIEGLQSRVQDAGKMYW